MKKFLISNLLSINLLIPMFATATELQSPPLLAASVSDAASLSVENPAWFQSLRVDNKDASVWIPYPGFWLCAVEIIPGVDLDKSYLKSVFEGLAFVSEVGGPEPQISVGPSKVVKGDSIRLTFEKTSHATSYGAFIRVSTKDGSSLKDYFDRSHPAQEGEALIVSVGCKNN